MMAYTKPQHRKKEESEQLSSCLKCMIYFLRLLIAEKTRATCSVFPDLQTFFQLLGMLAGVVKFLLQ